MRLHAALPGCKLALLSSSCPGVASCLCASWPLPPTFAVTLATLFPRLLAPLRASGEGLAAILMQAG